MVKKTIIRVLEIETVVYRDFKIAPYIDYLIVFDYSLRGCQAAEC